MSQVFNDFYRGRRVLVTGHTGFKGSWLCTWLAMLGAEVHGFALRPPSRPNLFADADVETVMTSSTIADIRDPHALLKTMQHVRPELVFHLAAQPLVLESFREPRDTVEVNVMGTVNLLEAVRRSDSVRVCQVVTSDKCYDNREWPYAYRENDALGGKDPYSSSKACAELVTAAYRSSFFSTREAQPHGVSLATVRAGNVIGGGDWSENRIVPDCVRALARDECIPVRNPHAVRPWQHVLEPLAGYLLLAQRQWQQPAEFGEAWNFGPGPEGSRNVMQLVATVVRHWGAGEWSTTDDRAQNLPDTGSVEANTLQLDCTRATSRLGWQPVYDFEAAVAHTVHWYREAQQATSNLQQLTRNQIQDFMDSQAQESQPWATAASL